ncbi:MAG: hypothetical protein NTV30_07690, partial [Chloroflexi bacterium]|nr:hypothetical protein [Chloroflexota bacterium]
GIKWNLAKFSDSGTVIFSEKDCAYATNEVIIGAFVHELGHLYQATITPGNYDLIESAGDNLPKQWGFFSEIEAHRLKSDELNS